jgi:hypothetical protein
MSSRAIRWRLFGRRKERVLVVGVYLGGRGTNVASVVEELARAKNYAVRQKWIALHALSRSRKARSVTVKTVTSQSPKFNLINSLLNEEPLERYEYVVICDDDIRLPGGFLDRFLALQKKHDFALAQPARTHNSYLDHPIVEQVDGLEARCTRFVEIGPVVSFRRDFLPLVFPFDETAPMGWGLDLVWPVRAQRQGLRLGIIDAVPVDHSLRAPAAHYDLTESLRLMDEYLAKTDHLPKAEAFSVLESYPAV